MLAIWAGLKSVKTLHDFGYENPIYKFGGVKMEKGKMPAYDVVVNVGKEGKDEKAIWHKIGSAWLNDKNISISLNSLPLGKQIFLFPKKEEK
jgi:hypothetical protein